MSSRRCMSHFARGHPRIQWNHAAVRWAQGGRGAPHHVSRPPQHDRDSLRVLPAGQHSEILEEWMRACQPQEDTIRPRHSRTLFNFQMWKKRRSLLKTSLQFHGNKRLPCWIKTVHFTCYIPASWRHHSLGDEIHVFITTSYTAPNTERCTWPALQ